MRVRFFLISFFLITSFLGMAQQTVGLFTNTVQSYDGYTLFSPIQSTDVYLIDNCGEKVHEWATGFKPAMSSYLLEDGNLLKPGRVGNPTFIAGGNGGIIEIIDWNGNVTWDYTLSSSSECQHHDIEYLPNGNILLIAWEAKTPTEVVQAGRVVSSTVLWSEEIIEIQPDLINGGGTVVWEWHVWDHLIQDADNTKDNFGVVGDSPELADINYFNGATPSIDWLHFNSIDYNPTLDQIIISNHNFSEIWVIDHSTTTLEAAGHTGGNSGMGGDLLYRWGNPITYDQGVANDQLLFLQHDARWIEDSLSNGGKIMVFNNQVGSPTNYSEVNIIDPPVDINGNYTYSGSAYAPLAFDWTYQAPIPTDFYASNISGAQPLANGNTLICEGPSGKLFEVDTAGTIVWEYVNPVSLMGITVQGTDPTPNSVFRATRIPSEYPGLAGQTLTPQGYIESGSTFTCNLFTGINEQNIELIIAPNPACETIEITSSTLIKNIEIINSLGEISMFELCDSNTQTMNLSSLYNGVYYLRIIFDDLSTEIERIVVLN